MPLLALLLRKWFLEVVAFFAVRMGAKMAVAAGAIVAIAAITAAFVAAMHALVASISLVWPAGIGFMLGMLPPIVLTYIGIFFAARVIVWVYVTNVSMIQQSFKF